MLENITKRCSKCQEKKSISMFSFNRGNTNKDGRHSWCKACMARARREYTKKYPEKSRSAVKRAMAKIDEYGLKLSRRIDLKRKYNLTPKEYMDLFNQQNGLCAITGLPLNDVAIDHDKNTGKIRGLILRSVNVAMGRFDHNPVWLRSAADYLEKNK